MSQTARGEHDYISTLVTAPSSGSYLCYFSKKSNIDFLDEKKDYSLSIDRYRIPISTIPVFYFDLSTNAYTVELEYKGILSGRKPLTFYTTSPSYPVTSDIYRSVWSCQHMVDMINIALSQALTALGLLVVLPVGTKAPFFSIDFSTNTLKLYCDQNYTSTLADHIKIYVNIGLQNYLEGFPGIVPTTLLVPSVHGRDFLFNVIDFHTNHISLSGVDYTIMTSESGLEMFVQWFVCKSIFLKTYNIKVRGESLPSSASTNLNKLEAPNTVSVLCNFDIVYNSVFRPLVLQYNIDSPYKIVDLEPRQGMRHIDYQVYWTDKYNVEHPLYLKPNDSMSLRMIFQEVI